MKTCIVVPAFNEEKVIEEVLNKIKGCYPPENILVIDDGSSDQTYEKAAKTGAQVYQHSINRGLGGALGTGLTAALLNQADFAVTLDADGQHDPEEIKNLLEPLIKDEADVVIGSRLLKKDGMPWIRIAYNQLGNCLTWLLFGIWTTDSQSGFRAFNHYALKRIQIKTNKMEVSSEFFKEIKGHKLRFKEVPITAIYTDYSMSKGQNFFMGLKTTAKLILLRFRK